MRRERTSERLVTWTVLGPAGTSSDGDVVERRGVTQTAVGREDVGKQKSMCSFSGTGGSLIRQTVKRTWFITSGQSRYRGGRVEGMTRAVVWPVTAVLTGDQFG